MSDKKIIREAVIKDVIDIFIETLGFLDEAEKKSVNENTHIIKDFNVVDIDSMAFDIALVEHFLVKPDLEEWGQAAHIREVADLFIKYMNKKP
ncbi:MAG: hypothetical protein COC05_01540 [Gammaproteobacteria bacterium]|nr:hypothetical protein [Beggiatoa alba]PCH61247.1 MAG: hypothetical protein COC05_01540 [Gammaproteobacteria bacterium]